MQIQSQYYDISEIQKFLELKQEFLLTKFIETSHLRHSSNIQEELQTCLIHISEKQSMLEKLYYISKWLMKTLEESNYHYEKSINELNQQSLKSHYFHKNEIDTLQEKIKSQQIKLNMIEEQNIEMHEQNQKEMHLKQQKQHQFLVVLNQKDNLKQIQTRLIQQNKKYQQQVLRLKQLNEDLSEELHKICNRNQDLEQSHLQLLKEYKALQENTSILKIDINNYIDYINKLQSENQKICQKLVINQSKGRNAFELQEQNKPLLINSSPKNIFHDILNQNSGNKLIAKFEKSKSSHKKQNLYQVLFINNSQNQNKYSTNKHWNHLNCFDQKYTFREEISEFIEQNSVSSKHRLNNQFDPYFCFFLLLTQCAKLNSKNFQKIAQINLQDYWQKLLNQRVPMHRWYKNIKLQLEKRKI